MMDSADRGQFRRHGGAPSVGAGEGTPCLMLGEGGVLTTPWVRDLKVWPPFCNLLILLTSNLAPKPTSEVLEGPSLEVS